MNAIEVVRHNNKAYNAHNGEALAATYAEGAAYSNPRAGKGLMGKAIANYAKAVWTAYPDASVELITVGDTGGGLVALQWVLRGTNTGTLPDGTASTGRTSTLPGATFTQVGGDKIRSEEFTAVGRVSVGNEVRSTGRWSATYNDWGTPTSHSGYYSWTIVREGDLENPKGKHQRI
jgi:hypothetical protein